MKAKRKSRTNRVARFELGDGTSYRGHCWPAMNRAGRERMYQLKQNNQDYSKRLKSSPMATPDQQKVGVRSLVLVDRRAVQVVLDALKGLSGLQLSEERDLVREGHLAELEHGL